jgi:hypothetical protein
MHTLMEAMEEEVMFTQAMEKKSHLTVKLVSTITTSDFA